MKRTDKAGSLFKQNCMNEKAKTAKQCPDKGINACVRKDEISISAREEW